MHKKLLRFRHPGMDRFWRPWHGTFRRGWSSRCFNARVAGSRQRRLPASSVVWLVIAIGLWGDRDIPALWRQVAGTLHDLLQAAGLGQRPPGKSALSKARSRLGARPLRQLFLAVSRPLARHTTRGAFYRGLRLMIIDGQKLLLPDTPANRKAFGKHTTRRSGRVVPAGYPQVQLMRLLEAGT